MYIVMKSTLYLFFDNTFGTLGRSGGEQYHSIGWLILDRYKLKLNAPEKFSWHLKY
jgi:hypothetical protein